MSDKELELMEVKTEEGQEVEESEAEQLANALYTDCLGKFPHLGGTVFLWKDNSPPEKMSIESAFVRMRETLDNYSNAPIHASIEEVRAELQDVVSKVDRIYSILDKLEGVEASSKKWYHKFFFWRK